MKLYFAQLEENREPFIDLFGEVCDDVIAWFMFLSAKRFITKKNFTMQDALAIMRDHFFGVTDGLFVNVQDFEKAAKRLTEYFTKPRFSKPGDVIIHDLIVDRPRNGLIVKWDYDDAWKAREKKKAEKRLHEIIYGKEKRPKKKA